MWLLVMIPFAFGVSDCVVESNGTNANPLSVEDVRVGVGIAVESRLGEEAGKRSAAAGEDPK